MLEARPGAYINIGNGDTVGSTPVHNPGYDFNDEILPLGAAALAGPGGEEAAEVRGVNPPCEAGRVASSELRAGWGSAKAATPPVRAMRCALSPPSRGGMTPPHLIPARMKLCTNWRWNSRKPISSGAEVISVAAQMTDQSMP